ncbi:MAG TPA: rhamnogalacturonan acetylesterase [Mucilaginibacter sp.]
MKTNTFRLLTLISVLFLAAFALKPKHITIYLVGDSTMSIKERKAYPETGWGMPFANFFDTTVTVDNRAKNGRSTKTFVSEGLWQPVSNSLKQGDYVFIQFGHNDEVKTKASYTPEDDYKAYLVRFITEAKNKNAIPILLTPVTRRYFDSTGHIKETHEVYSKIVRSVAADYHVALIDLDELSRTFFDKYGPETSQLFFNHLQPGENPNYPDGKNDDTHFNELGARKMAEIVLKSIRDQNLELANRIVIPQKK